MAGVRDNTVTNVVSGGIASFKSVGQVPLKSLKVNFNPIQEGDGDPSPSNIRPISGWTGCSLHKNGKNLFNTEIIKGAVTASDGTITVYSQGDRNRLISYYVEIPAGTYTISCKENKQINAYFYTEPSSSGYVYSERLQTWKNMPRTFTTTGRRFVAFVFRNSDNSNLSPSDMTEVQIEVGSTATTYEPYNGTTIPVSWSDLGTVYGGYVDLISGEVWKTFWHYTFTGEQTFYTSSNNWVVAYILPVDNYYPTAATPYEGMCSHYPYAPYSVGKIGVMYNERACTFDYRIHDAAGWKQYCTEQYIAGTPVQIAYKLKTPQLIGTIDPIEIKTLIGQNNIWSNADTVEAQYCALESLDIYKQRFKTNEPHLQNASGNIASFQTDMVAPLKECKVYFEPIQASGTPSPDNVLPISGWNNLEVYRTSKNIRNWTITDTTIPLDYAGGTGNFNGFGNTYWDNYWIIPESLWGKTITYSVEIVRAENPTNEYAEARCWTYTSSGVYTKLFTPPASQRYQTGSGRSTLTFTVPENTGRLALGILAGRGDRIYNPIVSIGSTAIEYEPYNGSTTSITLPSTYYGGYCNPITGQGVITWYMRKLDSSTPRNDFTTTIDSQIGVWGYRTNDRGSAYQAGIASQNPSTQLFCDKMVVNTVRGVTDATGADYVIKTRQGTVDLTNRNRIYFTWTGMPTDRTQYLDELLNNIQPTLAWNLETPISFSFTPINSIKTLYDTNNIWSNTNGITQVKYWTHGSITF